MKKRISSIVLITTLMLMAVVAPIETWAAWSNDPAVNTPISTETGDQTNPQIVTDGAGGAIITWQDSRNGNDDIYAQRIGADGIVKWTPNGVAISTAAGDQRYPQIVTDGAGGAIITWQDSRNGNDDIYAQRIDADGNVKWTANGVAVCTAANVQTNPQIVSDGAGGAIITWQDSRNGNDDIYAQRLGADGNVIWTANGVVICDASSAQTQPKIVSDYSGGAIITWTDARNGADTDVYAQRIGADGNVKWTLNGVAICTAVNVQTNPQIVTDGAGGAIITWQDYRPVGGSIYAQKIDRSGNLLWAADGVAVFTVVHNGTKPAIADDGNGGAIITWMDTHTSSYKIYAQRIDKDGTIQWAGYGLAIGTAHGDLAAHPLQITSDGSGSAIVAWQDYRNSNDDIYAQKIAANGTIQWGDNGVAISTATGDQLSPQIVSDGSGGAIITWMDQRPGATGVDIYGQKVMSNHTSLPLYADLAGYGIYKWDGTTWSQLNGIDPAKMVASGAALYVSGLTGNPGVFKWDGTTWSQLNGIDPANMVTSGSILYADLSGSGIWQWNGSAWSHLNGISPANMVTSGAALYVSGLTGNPGVFKWDGTAWSHLNGIDPANMVTSGAALYVSGLTGNPGVFKWDGTTWSQLNGIDPAKMVASGAALYVSGLTGSPGVFKWDGTTWSQLNEIDPANMVTSGSNLYADLGSGIWQWNGSAWSHLNGISPANMVTSGAILYADLSGSGIWQWNGTAWSQLDGIDLAIMVAD